jgi:porin
MVDRCYLRTVLRSASPLFFLALLTLAQAGSGQTSGSNREPKYTLQVGAFATIEEAKDSLSKLNAKKIGGFISRVPSSPDFPYKVGVGKFKTNREAIAFATFNLQPEGILYFVARLNALETPRAPTSNSEARPMGQAEQQAAEDKKEQEGALLGAWGGAKPYLSKRGIEVDAVYKFDLVRNYSGGLDQKATAIGNFNLKTGFDLEKMGLVKGLRLNLYGLANHGNPATEFVGDSFATSNIQSPDGVRLFETYLEQNVDEHIQVSVGLRDLCAIYNVSATAGEFINSTFALSPSFSQTGRNGPSVYPKASLAANAKYVSANSFYFQTGVFNALAGDPNHPHSTEINASNREGSLMVYETGFSKPEGDGSYKFGAGAWVYTKNQDRIDGLGEHQNAGYYFIADKKISQVASAFVKYGIAQPSVNKFENSTEVGVTLTGIIPKRGSDVLAFGVGYSKATEDYKTANASTSGEAAIELLYKIDITRGLKIIPDFQHIVHPGLDPNVKDAQVGTLRIELGF